MSTDGQNLLRGALAGVSLYLLVGGMKRFANQFLLTESEKKPMNTQDIVLREACTFAHYSCGFALFYLAIGQHN